jgi:transcription elongation factor Elf1
MTKSDFLSLLRSLTITLVIAAIPAFLFANPVQRPLLFTAALVIGIIAQFAIFWFLGFAVNQFAVGRAIREASQQQTADIKSAMDRQSLPLNCAYCNTSNVVPVVVSQENFFKCFHCGQENAVFMQFFAARVTNPVALKADVDRMTAELDEKTG